MPKKLSQLFADFPFSFPLQIPDIQISGIAIDSRAVKLGDLFVAMRGESVDGHNYIPKAIDNGASAVVGDKGISGLSVPYIRLENSRQALSWLACEFFDW